MRRRTLLAAAATGLAGCVGSAGDDGATTSAGTEGTTAGSTRTTAGEPLARRGFPSSICQRDPVDIPIYAVDDPAFADDWSGIDVPALYRDGLDDAATVVGLAAEGRARAYPLSVLWHHEIVNDTFEPVGGAVLVTFCSLCRSGMVARRLVEGFPTTFRVSGQLWRPPEVRTRAAEADNRTFGVGQRDPNPGKVRNEGNLVLLDDATGSYWSQLLAEGICGPQRGTRLEVLPAETATWRRWRSEHPDTEVLLPPPLSGTVED